MAHIVEPDTIDFRAYERATDAAVKVRRASLFRDDLVAEFAQLDGEPINNDSTMTSTKLRGRVHFRPGEVTVWAGYNGHRKSMFVGQVVLDLCQQGQRVLVASMEMLPQKTLGRMARQATAARWPSIAWIDDFGHWSDNRLWLFDHMGRITPGQCIAVCRYFAEELKGQHVVIDSLMMVCASEDTFDEQKQFVTDLCRVAQETGLHIHLVAHCRKPQSGEDKPPSKYDIRGTSAISDQVSNVILVWQNKPKQQALEKDPTDQSSHAKPDALVIVEKQRNGQWEGRVQLWFHVQSLRFCDDRTSTVEPMLVASQLPVAT